MTDDLNQPLDRLGGTTPGVVSLRFIPATWDAATGYYDDLINSSNGNPSRDNTGTWADLGNGKYNYVNAFKDFVPATNASATTWAVTTTAKCNACHDPIVGHGSNYREAK